MSAPVPEPSAVLSVPVPSVSGHENAVATAAAVAANATLVAPPSAPGSFAKRTPASVPSAAAPPVAKSGKSKKKKSSQVMVTMATAPSSQASGHGAAGENTGRWTAEEHRLFLQGLDEHGKGWKKIASLIKSRTVVQIRTHAQKYFQKLAKARQNGEEGEISMEGRGGLASLPSITTSTGPSSKRRRQTSGTKRKAIQSVVASAQRQGKKTATGEDLPPAVAPSLRPYVLSSPIESADIQPYIPSVPTAHGSVSGPALEDSLFRFLTPVPVAPAEPQVNEVARQAGAQPITLPTDMHDYSTSGGDVSPTGVAEFVLYPSWTDAKDTPSWYAKGSDVDALLDVADTLDWLTDTGDLNETYPPADHILESASEIPDPSGQPSRSLSHAPSTANMSMNTLPRVESGAGVVVPPLPSLFDGGTTDADESSRKLSSHQLVSSTSTNTIDEHLQVFDDHLEEHDFVSSMLDNPGESVENLIILQ